MTQRMSTEQYRQQHGLAVKPMRVQPKARQMNKLEARYAAHLDTLKAIGDIRWYAYESMKLRLADNTFYTPDFIVWTKDWHLEAHEVKGGFIRDDAAVKFKVARELYPILGFRMMQFKGGWNERTL